MDTACPTEHATEILSDFDHSTKVAPTLSRYPYSRTEKNGFVTATKLGTNEFFVASTKNFVVATKRFVDRTKDFVVVTIYFCYPYFNK